MSNHSKLNTLARSTAKFLWSYSICGLSVKTERPGGRGERVYRWCEYLMRPQCRREIRRNFISHRTLEQCAARSDRCSVCQLVKEDAGSRSICPRLPSCQYSSSAWWNWTSTVTADWWRNKSRSGIHGILSLQSLWLWLVLVTLNSCQSLRLTCRLKVEVQCSIQQIGSVELPIDKTTRIMTLGKKCLNDRLSLITWHSPQQQTSSKQAWGWHFTTLIAWLFLKLPH